MIDLWQKHPKWGGVTIGKTDVLVRDRGCTITCVSMASDYFGVFYNPGFLAQVLTFTPKALLVWGSIEQKCHGFKFRWRFYKYDEKIIDEALKNPRKVALLNVQNGSHWVVAIKRIPFTSTFWVSDPWTGTRKLMRGVVGGAILEKN